MQCHVSPAFAVHPRTGGEHFLSQLWLVQENTPPGSSPHGRGTQRDMREPEFKRRFIPARAGNTCRARRCSRCAPVHPRTGGEHPQAPIRKSPPRGSSPHGRGTHDREWECLCRHRFIPARAGNTGRSSAGSSPHGRGTRAEMDRVDAPCRFIPARAGNTVSSIRPCSADTVHPRTGGEHHNHGAGSDRSIGSSPHGRGTQFVR